MEFILTNHARRRMQERNIPSPETLIKIKPAGKKQRKLIREQCKLHGVKNHYQSNYIYYVAGKHVFVCISEKVGSCIVLTAFPLAKAAAQAECSL